MLRERVPGMLRRGCALRPVARSLEMSVKRGPAPRVRRAPSLTLRVCNSMQYRRGDDAELRASAVLPWPRTPRCAQVQSFFDGMRAMMIFKFHIPSR